MGVWTAEIWDAAEVQEGPGCLLGTGVCTVEVRETSVEREEVWDTSIEGDVDRGVVDVHGTAADDWVVCDEGGAV